MTDRQDILQSLALGRLSSYTPTGDFELVSFGSDEVRILKLYSRDHDHTIIVNKDQNDGCQVYDDDSERYSEYYSTAGDVAREIRNRMQS